MTCRELINVLKNCTLTAIEQEAVCKLSHGNFGDDKEYYLIVLQAVKTRNLYHVKKHESNL